MVEAFREIQKCIRKTQLGFWELTEPHLLYLDDQQSADYLKVMADKSYSGSFHNDTVTLIENHIAEIFPDCSENVSLIDLGPGYPDKSLSMAKFLKKHGAQLKYFPVDVSESYLKISADEMRPYCADIVPLKERFEDLSNCTAVRSLPPPVYAMIGLTFMNFPKKQILSLLKKAAGKSGRVIFATELVTEKNSIEKILSAYAGEAMKKFTFGPLAHLGFDTNQIQFDLAFANGRVEHRFKILNRDEIDSRVPFQVGDVVITAVSYRYTPEQVRQIVVDEFKRGQIWYSDDGKTALVVGVV